uniref:Ribosomal protein S8 n=1 Tax=Nitzschia sp. IriIs04 TaxID=1444690 RepID=A0A0S3QPQ8_9STRA|nr:ribosomal protein S8 [Nitzschia sp. IriIs04]BAT70299.1 ribosomal protein S8 [Nitzschia sp. IriIs04]
MYIISHLINQIKQSIFLNHKILRVYKTKKSYFLVNILYKEGFIQNFEEIKENNKKFLLIYLDKIKQFKNIKVISKPGVRIYQKIRKELKNFHIKKELMILSTSKGIITNKKAKYLNIGGEILFYIY